MLILEEQLSKGAYSPSERTPNDSLSVYVKAKVNRMVFLRSVRLRLRSLGERYIKEICSSVMTGFAGF